MNKLVVLGSVNADHVLQVPSFPRPGETLHGASSLVLGMTRLASIYVKTSSLTVFKSKA